MRRDKRNQWITAAVLAVLIPAVSLLPAPAAGAEEPGWTVLVYMVGSDLESKDILNGGGNATGDLQEMLRSAREDTELLIMTGGASRWWGMEGLPEIPADRCCIWKASGGSIQAVWEGPGSMGSPDMLCALLDMLPAERKGPTALIFWDHGYGPMEGFGSDLTGGDTILTLPEIASAFVSRRISERKFSLIGFDACLMGSCETVLAMQPFTEYLVASEDTEPLEGWDYGFLEMLSGRVSPGEAGREIVSRYDAYYRKQNAENPNHQQIYSLALIDLRRASLLKPAVNTLFGALEEEIGTGNFSTVSRLRSSSWNSARATAWQTEYDLVDVHELASKYEAGRDVLSALSDCIVDYRGNLEKNHGLSVYFPQKASAENRKRWQDVLKLLSPGQAWISFIERYESDLAAGQMKVYQEAAQTDQQYTVYLTDEQLEDFASAEYVILEEGPYGGYRDVYRGYRCVVEENTVRADYRDTWICFHVGDQSKPKSVYLIDEDDTCEYYLTMVVVFTLYPGGFIRFPESVCFRIAHNKISSEWTIYSSWGYDEIMEEGFEALLTGKKREIQLQNFEEVWIGSEYRLPTRDQAGTLLPFSDWDMVEMDYVRYSYIYELLNGISPEPENSDFGLGMLCRTDEHYFFEEVPLVRKEGKSYWLQMIITDVYNNQYASEVFPLS